MLATEQSQYKWTGSTHFMRHLGTRENITTQVVMTRALSIKRFSPSLPDKTFKCQPNQQVTNYFNPEANSRLLKRVQGTGTNPYPLPWVHEDFSMRSFVTCTLHQILLGRSNKEGEMGEACRTHGKHEKCIQNYSRKTWGDETTRKPCAWLGRQYQNGSRGNRVERCGLDASGSGTGPWRAAVNTVMNLRVP
jgi:hypothetical protein